MATSTIPQISTVLGLPASDDYGEVGGVTNGSKKVTWSRLTYQVADLTALAALVTTGAASGIKVIVAPGVTVGDGLGTYTFNATATDTPNGTTIIAGTGGTGRWFRTGAPDSSFTPSGAPLLKASNLSDLANAGTARTNLGLGSAATQPSSAFDASGAAAAVQAASLQKSANLSDVANKATSKQNLNILQINVRDFGATGNGSTDDLAAINSALAALTSYSSLYFPKGKYRITGSLNAISSLSNVSIFGDGSSSEIYNDSGSSGGNTLVINWGCSFFDVAFLNFTGSSTVRGNGIHIRMASYNSKIHHCYFSGCSDFAVYVSGASNGYIYNVQVSNNHFGATLGDGCHVGSAFDVLVSDNICNGTGDDALAVVMDDTSFPPTRVSFIGNKIDNAGNTSGCGIRVCESVDILIQGNTIKNTVEAGIKITRNLTTTVYSYRITISDNVLIGTGANGGQTGAITLQWSNWTMVANNFVDTQISGSGINFLDCNDLCITGNFLLNQVFRGIAGDDGTTTNVATTWSRITITGNTVDTCNNEAIYAVPGSGITIGSLMISGNNAVRAANGGGSNYIFCNRLSGVAKIVNNTSIETLAANGFGGSGSTPTYANNN